MDDLKGILDYIAQDKPEAARAFVDDLIKTCRDRGQSGPGYAA
jgi:plasmid stabilization system protein ParE